MAVIWREIKRTRVNKINLRRFVTQTNKLKLRERRLITLLGLVHKELGLIALNFRQKDANFRNHKILSKR